MKKLFAIALLTAVMTSSFTSAFWARGRWGRCCGQRYATNWCGGCARGVNYRYGCNTCNAGYVSNAGYTTEVAQTTGCNVATAGYASDDYVEHHGSHAARTFTGRASHHHGATRNTAATNYAQADTSHVEAAE